MSSSESDWTQRRAEGFALAATAQADKGAAYALAGVHADALASAGRVARSLASGTREQRRRWLQTMVVRPPTPQPVQSGRPPRALALLATTVDKPLGRQWLANAPLPRPGFRPDPGLLFTLRTLAARPVPAPDSACGDAS